MIFCSSQHCTYCNMCREQKKELDSTYRFIDLDSEKTPPLCVFILLDCRTFFVQKFLEKSSHFNQDESHTQVIGFLCYLFTTLLTELQHYWKTNLQKILSDTNLSEVIDMWLAAKIFTARQFQRFMLQLRSFLCDGETVVFEKDGKIIANWNKKRRQNPEQNDVMMRQQYLSLIDRCISNLNQTIANTK